jgi:adenylosuccinate synthase
MDVLDAFSEIQVATGYRYDDMESEEIPFDIVDKTIEPVYEGKPGWNESLDAVRSYSDLPQKAKEYIHALEEMTQTRISMISTGPEREKLFSKNE